MAGGGPPVPEGGGEKRAVDFQLNLVPFIDLLSVLISFLLMTTVWTQVAKIDVKQKPNQPGPPSVDPPVGLELTILIRSTGYSISSRVGPTQKIEKRGSSFDAEALSRALKQIRAVHGAEADKVQVQCEDKVPYEELIRVMDVCLEHRMTGISVGGVDA